MDDDDGQRITEASKVVAIAFELATATIPFVIFQLCLVSIYDYLLGLGTFEWRACETRIKNYPLDE